MTRLIDRNTTIPTRKSEVFSTASDQQPSVEVHVLQGERQMARDNKSLGKFHLDGIPPAPRGVPQIEVTFDIDANGVVNVSAKDRATGKEQKITITGSSGLSKDEVDKMMKDAELHAEEDRKRREQIETRNKAEQAAYQAERMLADAGDKLTDAEKQPVTDAVAAVRKALEGDDAAAITSAVDALMQVQGKAAEALYRQAQAGTPGAGPSGQAGSDAPVDGEVIDAEVVDEK
jgi:molecular chaperone DnaK